MVLGGCVLALAVGFADRLPVPAFKAGAGTGTESAQSYVSDYDEEVIPRSADGHYWLEAEVNGGTVRFLVDTGASHVVLTPEDAQAAGIYPAHSDFTAVYQTANGPAAAAPVILDRVEVGGIEVRGVPAAVNGAPMRQSLLGMSFLQRLSSFEVAGDRLILRR
jgi:aspartyl protease family protein